MEGSICDDSDRIVAETAPGAGLNHVYRGRSSLAQPDFTAECLAARNQGTEVLLIILDQNSAGRVSSACARLGYRPTYVLIGQGVSDRMKEDPNLGGTIASATVFPYFQTGTPATDEFHQALRTYGKGVALGVGVAFGWTAGKLFERAAVNLPEPPTRAALLRGLWSIRNDTRRAHPTADLRPEQAGSANVVLVRPHDPGLEMGDARRREAHCLS